MTRSTYSDCIVIIKWGNSKHIFLAKEGSRCPGLGRTHHVISRSVRLGRGPPWPYTHGPVRTAAADKEDSTRLGDQDKDSSPTGVFG